MAEYVGREAVRDLINEEIESWGSCQDEKEALWNLLDRLYDDITAADVVEVVRCKDCKWCSQSGLCNLYIGFTPSMKPDDFCSYGERMGADMREEEEHT